MNYNKNLYNTLEKIHQTHLQLEKELENVGNNSNKIVELNKNISQVEDTSKAFVKYKNLINNIEQSLEILNSESDSELLEMAQFELNDSKEKLEKMELDLQIMLLPKDPNEGRDVMIEIRPAAGGDESSIFVRDIFEAYRRYATNKNWKLMVMDISQNAIGISYLSFSLSGKDVYSKMKFESGVHRVQRVPETESKGRVHTSTITVSVMPEQDEVEVKIEPKDLRVDVYRAGGAGGQHVNKTESAVRITHLPTGIVAACQEGKSQIQNREKAMKMLRAKLWDLAVQKQQKEVGDMVRSQVGTGDRSEKVRTYNYPQNRVTDHRIGLTINRLDTIILGDLDAIHDALINDEHTRKLAELTKE